MGNTDGGGTGEERDTEPPVRVLAVGEAGSIADRVAASLEQSDLSPTVVPVPDAAAALDRLDGDPVDCVVAAHDLPGRDGVDLLETVRERHPGLPFVLFADGDRSVARTAAAAGVTGYVPRTDGSGASEALARQVTDAVDLRRGAPDDDAAAGPDTGSGAVERRQDEAELAELNRINRTLRRTIQRVVRADDRTAVLQAVCESLADSDPYLFAWVGRVDDDEIVPEAHAGIEGGYLDDITVTADDSPTGQGPGGRAARTREPQAMGNVHEDPEFEPWREAASERGYESVASIPLEYDDRLYGLLNVYADRPGAFDERELAVLAELGTTVAHAVERVELTEQLREQYRDLFEEAPTMAVQTRNEDGEPYVEAANRLFLERLGYEREAVEGEPLAAFYTERSTEDLLDEGGYARALADEFTREERELVTADGEVLTTLLRAVPRRDESGEVVGSLALYIDISERKQLERENERLDAFTSIVSHDLRNPLNVIQGRTELAAEECGSEHLDAIEDAAARMQRLIDDLLTLARQGETVGTLGTVDLGVVAERAWGNVDTGSATLTVDAAGDILADPDRLAQLLENCYRNAVEHAGPDVTVRVGELDARQGFFVEDDGPGIPPAERDQVFEQGYSSKAGGTGFGLTIVQRVAEAHGWAVAVTGSDSGGARFEFTGVDRPD